MAATKRKEKKPIKTGASSRHITNLKQSILETFDIYEQNTEICKQFPFAWSGNTNQRGKLSSADLPYFIEYNAQTRIVHT